MRLRIVSGELKGRLLTIKQKEGFRPTLERTRESVAEILKNDLPGSLVADLCAGSGAFGFEMLSRGAKNVDFFERDRALGSLILKNAHSLLVADSVRVFFGDVRRFIKSGRKYDIIYYDPPYDDEELKDLVPELIKNLLPSGILVYERRRLQGEKKPLLPGEKKSLTGSRLYGDTAIEFYTNR